MNFENKLIKAKIIKRYKRFLSDIELESGEVICAHVPNTGSMQSCWAPGWSVFLSHSDNPKRKLKYTLELTHNGESFIAVNTSATNKIVKEALENGDIAEFKKYNSVKAEQKILDSRLDFVVTNEDGEHYIEVKNVTLKGEDDIALFPDAVTTRGQKHLRDLIKIVEMGHKATMLYIVNRQDVNSFTPAKDIDPVYAKLLKEASENGVQILAYQTTISTAGISISHKLQVNL